MRELKTVNDKVGYVYDTFEAAYDIQNAENGKRKNDTRAVRYYVGDSLTDKQKRNLQDAKLPKLEINIVKPKVDLLTGIERETRTSTVAYPIENGDAQVASGIDWILEYIKNSNNMDATSSRVFKDAVITGEGDYSIEPKLAKDFSLDIAIRREPIGAIIWDPESIETDPNDDAEFVIRQKWMSPEKVGSVYKKDYKKLKLDMSDRGDNPRGGVENGDFYANVEGRNSSMYFDRLAGRARVIEMWYKKYNDVAYLIDGDGQQYRSPLPIAKAKKVFQRYINAGFEMIVTREHEIWVMAVSGAELLEDKKSPYSHNRFPFVPSYGYIEDDGEEIKKFGIVKNLYDLQDEKNSRHTQISQILKTAPIGGGWYQANSVDGDKLNQASGVQKWTPVNRIDDIKERGYGYLPILNQIASLEEITEQDGKEVTGVNDPMLGIPTGAKESGLAAQVRIRQGTRTVQELFDNHDRAKLQVMRMALGLAQQYFDEKKIMRILGTMTSPMGQQQAMMVAQSMKTNKDLLQYDLKLDKGQNSVTQRNATFLKTMELAQLAPEYRAVLLPHIIALTDHPNKDEILKEIGVQSQIINTEKAIGLTAGGKSPQPKGGSQNTRQQIAE
jgi:hypothetical protein